MERPEGEAAEDGGSVDAAVEKPARPKPGYPIQYRPSAHEALITEYFSEPGRTLVADWSPLPVDWSLVVCFVNRSGSNWLTDLLAATRKAGRAGEYLNADVVTRQSDQREHASLDDYLRFLAKRTGRGRCFAFKTGIAQLHFLRKSRIIPDLIPKAKYLLVRRKDVAAQALSFIKAADTKEWQRFEGQEPKPFDYAAVHDRHILGTIQSITDQYAGFEQYFATFGIDYISVVYEDLMDDTPGEFARIASELGIEVEDAASLIASARTSVMQRDEESERRIRRFHRAMGRR
jgi:LPS sulfotransferase NodH